MLEFVIIKTFISLYLCKLLANPQQPIQERIYPSGVKEADKYYYTDRPSTKNPLLKMSVAGYDTEYNKLEPGIYSVFYSKENNSLIISGGKDAVKAPVFQLIKLNQAVNIPTANIARIEDKKIYIIFKNENIEVHAFLYLPEAILERQ